MANRLTPIILAALLVAGCATREPEPLTAEEITQIPPPEFSRELPPEAPTKPAFSVCRLGTSCLSMDPRPFETCLVANGVKRCADKALESVEVQAPIPPADPGIIETVARE